MRFRKTLIVTAACTALVAGAGFLYSPTHATQSVHGASTVPAVPVVAGTVQSGTVPIYLRGIGNVQAYNTVTVHSQITGPITQINFKEGQAVHKGDLLAVIDPRPFQAQLDQAIANEARDEAQLANAQQLYQRDLPVLAKGFVPAQTVETQKDQVTQFEAMIQSDKAQIETARVNLSYTRLTSPIDGVVGIRLIDIGNIVHPTDPGGIVVITQLQPISVMFTLPETDLLRIQQSMTKGAVTALAYSQDDKTLLDKGSLAVLDNQIVQTSGSARLKANFPNPANRLWPGELIDVRLLVESLPNALTVAATAVQQGPQGPYVYVIKPDHTVEQRPVMVGQTTASRAVITSGLKPNEQIVANGQSRLQPGSHVAVLQGTAAQQLVSQEAQQTVIP